MLGCAQATFFHLSAWTLTVQKVLGHRAYCLYAVGANGAIEGVLPLGHVRSRLFGNSLVSVPFAVYGGVAANNNAAAHALDAAARALAEELAVDWLELRNQEKPVDAQHVSDLYVTFRKAIAGDSEANLAAIPRKQRAMVRKAIAADLQTRIDSNVDDFYTMYSQSVRNLGTPVLPKSWYAALSHRPLVIVARCSLSLMMALRSAVS